MRNQLLLEPDQFWKGMQVLAASEPHTSYRTPLALESAFLELFEALRTSQKTPSMIRNVESVERTLPSSTLTIHPASTPLASKRDGRSKGSKS